MFELTQKEYEILRYQIETQVWEECVLMIRVKK